ncbi:helix-turn-helix domain-containing protein [Amedibacillus dolichus]|uniref:helix-turn-helix domain-containing protein n=1 Tax=Amedibacillus dolichus TaxID=31971 RepID=UPI001D026247|nr:XRE family transcriptional regulator [Amedibacillus dolichus]MCB5373987.1 helix-turn-helix domain-containing protein [Amedibacillus dolichus]
MRKFKDVLTQLRQERNISQRYLSEQLGLSHGTIGMYENGKREPNYEILESIADYFNVDMNYLLGKTLVRNSYRELGTTDNDDYLSFDNIFRIEKKKLPFLGYIACGEPIFADEDRESYMMVGMDIKADFCLKCKGDSMINARIHDGDIVFIRKQDIVANGEIAAIIIEEEATLKRFYYYKDQNMVILKPENPKYEDIVLMGEKLEKVKVLGKAVAFQSDVV